MKKIKWILLILTIFLMIVFLFATCRKAKAMESGFVGYNVTISARDSDHYNAVILYNLGYNSSTTSSDFCVFGSTNYLYLNINPSNVLSIRSGSTSLETYQLTDTRLIECRIVEDLQNLYLIIYKITYTTQGNQTQEPVIDGISRTMLTRYLLPATVSNIWENGDLNITLMWNNPTYYINYLVNYSYIDTSETVQDINNWVDLQLSNYLTYNNLIHAGYLAGNENGYLDGFDDGEERGYSDGYDAGYDDGELVGHANGYQEGANDGYSHGYDEGYHEGWTDGQAGETAISPAFNILSDIFGVVATVFQIELVPHVPLGLFFLVPLFFSAIGLILWIWRRN